MSSNASHDGLPPFVKTWRQMYAFVIGTLVSVILLLYLFMQYFK